MLAWPHLREINYLSASALKKLESDPIAFYWDRLGPPDKKPKREALDFPPCVGTLFDAHIKRALSDQLSLWCPSYSHMIRDFVKYDRLIEANTMAIGLLKGYILSGAMGALLLEQPRGLAAVLEDDVDGVPVQCKLDGETVQFGAHDWKVTGANKPGEYSPKPGYLYCWDTNMPGYPKGPHERYQEPMENIDEDWATQIALYSIVLRRGTGSIDQVLVGEAGRVRVAQYRTGPSEGFVQRVRDRLRDAWERIQNGKVIGEAERVMR
jgi:hypothetical protein